MAKEKKDTRKKAAKTNPKSDGFMEKLKQFVRTEGCNYLQDKISLRSASAINA